MAKLEEKNVLDYRMGGDTVDDFAQKYMAEMTRIYQFLNNLREHNSTGTEQVEPVSYQIKVEDDKIYIRNFANDAWIYLMAVASHGGFRSDTFGKLAYGSASDKPTSGVSTGDTYWGDDGRVYRYNGEKWSLLLSLNVADLTGYDTLITKNDVTTPTDTTTIYKEPQKIPRTNDNGVLPFDISGNAGSIAGVKNEVNNLQDGEVLTYRTVSNSWRNEPKGTVGAGKSFVLKDGDKVIADYSGDVHTEADIGLTAHNDNANGKSHPNQLRPPLKRSTEYAVGDIVFHDSLPSWAYLECVTSGTTSEIEQNFGGTALDTVTDGSCVWHIRDCRCRYRLGDIVAKVTAPVDYDYLLLCDGSTIDEELYPELVKAIGGTKLPDMQGRFLQGDNGAAMQYREAGLPNITGNLESADYEIFSAGIKSDGALDVIYKQQNYQTSPTYLPDTCSRIITFDASKSNTIYGNSDTVQPPAMTAKFYICYAG